MVFKSGQYRKVELFACAVPGKEGLLQLSESGNVIFKNRLISCNYQRFCIPVTEGEYCFEMKDAHISQMYLRDSRDMPENGIRYLMVNDTDVEMIHMKDFLDTPFREQYHFTPFVNWMNDPNGLCWYKGYYHLFYQANPHRQKWGKMYWGHAVSSDLIHWKHLPFALEPQEEIRDSDLMTGGAFSGSAVATKEEIRLFFTRDAEVIGDPASIRQYQASVRSRDGIDFGEEEELLPAFSLEGANANFRDPKVFSLDQKWYMAIASNYYGKAAVLLYASEDMQSWKFVRPLRQFEDSAISSAECPDFFRLGDRYVLLASLMDIRSENGVYQPVKYYIGHWEKEEFQSICEGMADFGGNFYAAQTFEHEERRILFGWICDWHGEHEREKNGSYGSFTIPRELSLKGNCLCQAPAKEVYSLLGEVLFEGKGCTAADIKIPGNCYYSELLFSDNTGFEITLAVDGEDSMKLLGDKGELEILSTKNRDKDARFATKTEKIRKIEIFMDRRVVEVYVNDGERAGTKIFVNHSKGGVFRAFFDEPARVKRVLVRKMETIW